MHDYLFSTEVVRFAFMFGVAVSMLLYERRHLTTGSIVVPGYVAVFLAYPLIIVATFINALISYYLVNKVLRRWFLLYGRTKFTILAMISISIQAGMLKFAPSGPWLWESDIKLFVGVGYVVPALIAHDMARQGIKKTTKSVMLAAGIVATPIALALAFNLPGVNDLAPLQGAGEMAISASWIPFAVLLSACAAWGVANNYGCRSGGFVGAGFVAMLLGDPWQVVAAICIAAITYVIVTKFLMNSMILFGRRKFSSMLLVSSAISWSLLWLGNELFPQTVQSHLQLGSLALTPLFIPGLLANDSQRVGPKRVAFGLTLASSFVLATTWWVQSLFEGFDLAIGWKLLAVASFASIFWKQFVPKRESAEADSKRPATAPATSSPTILASAASFGRSSYQKWATIHQDAADAAERWLSAMLGEPIHHAPLLAIGQPTNGAAPDGPAPSNRVELTANGMTEGERSTARLRRAALEALRAPVPGERRPFAEPEGLPIRHSASEKGEFDAVATSIAAGVGRPQPLPRRQPKPVVDTEASNPTTRSALQAVRVESESTIRVDRTAGSSGAAAERAQPAAPETRDNHVPRKEDSNSVFPG